MIRLVNHNHHVFFLFEFFSVLNDSQRDTISDILMVKDSLEKFHLNNFIYFSANQLRSMQIIFLMKIVFVLFGATFQDLIGIVMLNYC